MESTELFAFSATFERSPPLPTAPFTHPNNPAGGAAVTGGGTEVTSPLLAGITGLKEKYGRSQDSMVSLEYQQHDFMTAHSYRNSI